MLMVPPAAPSGQLRFEWVDPGGIVRDLTFETSPRLFVSAWPGGLGAPPVVLGADKLPFAGGSLLRHVAIQPGRIELPITIAEDSLSDLVQACDALRDWFGRTGDEQGFSPGYLRITREDNTVRQIACYYDGGLEGVTNQGPFNAITYVISLRAPDPWPTDPADTVYGWVNADLPTVSIMNAGQFDAYPIWEITGPFGAVAGLNVTTGRFWTLVVALAAGRSLILDTRPANLRDDLAVYTTDLHQNLFQYFAPNSDLFPLIPGQNDLSFTFSGSPATTVATAVDLSFRQRYRGLLR